MECVVGRSLYLTLFSSGPANIPSNQHFKKNFPSLEEREARGTKRTISNDPHHDNTPVPSFNEMDHMNSE